MSPLQCCCQVKELRAPQRLLRLRPPHQQRQALRRHSHPAALWRVCPLQVHASFRYLSDYLVTARHRARRMLFLTYRLSVLIMGSYPIQEVGLHRSLIHSALDIQRWLPCKPVHRGFCCCHEALVESGLVIHQGICLWLFSWLHVCAAHVRQDLQASHLLSRRMRKILLLPRL